MSIAEPECSLSLPSALADKFAQLYSGHHGWLHGWLRRKLGCHERAADLAHDTFVRLMARQQVPDGSEPRALLAHVAKGLLIDHWRRQDVEQACLEALASLPEAFHPSPEARSLVVEALCRIDRMLQGVPAQTREVFLLSQLDGMTYPDIAARLTVSLATVKRHMKAGFVACMLVS